MLPDFVTPYLDDLEDLARPYLSILDGHGSDLIYVGGATFAALFAIGAIQVMLSHFTSPSLAPTITVKWDREKLRIPLPELDSKLGTLRHTIAEKTGLEPSAFKLVHSGGVMKDNNSTLSACGIKKGSKIVVIDGAAHANGQIVPELREKKARPTTEEGSKELIRSEMQRINQDLAPALDVFLKQIEGPTATPSSSAGSDPLPTVASSFPQPTASAIPVPQPTVPDIEFEHRRLSEDFVQALLRLDELHLDSVWTEARTDRKGAIKTVQALLDRLDKGWRERSERLTAQ